MTTLPKSLTESWLNRFGPLNLYSKIFWCSWDIHSFMIKICLVKKQPLEVFYKKGVLKNFANSTEKKLCSDLFLIKSQALGLQLYQKETWAHVFPYESCEIYFEEHLPTTGSISRCFNWTRGWQRLNTWMASLWSKHISLSKPIWCDYLFKRSFYSFSSWPKR